ncbi:MAG: hypothetical protein K9L98_02745 [Candidatus Pacebacteria bacterium]|nr:hypothetical protein [Candidatus Paceibacterota bacterium]MCF7862903.1 hypothetical protein [Candidatus Paceibacterota bacterium]
MPPETKNCQNCKNDFMIESEDFLFYQKIKVPPPTFCPECRMQRRFMWRNERSLYKRDCDLCKKSFISLYPKDSCYTIYCRDCWYSDNWDPIDFGIEYDNLKSFFELFRELQLKVPRLGIWTVQCTNSPYTNQSYNNKNCYLSYGFRDSEDCMYVARAVNLKKCMDVVYSHYSENLYEAFNVEKSYNTFYSEKSEALIDSYFVSNSRNISNCFGIINKRNSSYTFMGENLSKDAYLERLKEIDLGSKKIIDEYKKLFDNIKKQSIHKYGNLVSCQNSTGDNLVNTKNSKMVFDGFDLENSRYSAWVFSSKEIYDCYGMGNSQYVYEAMSPEEVSNTKFVHVVDTSNNVEYSEMCKGSSFLFGCISLQKKSYCILNKQYTKEEYQILIEKIKEEMNSNPYIDKKNRIYKYGEFFPYDLSPFSYNESTAQEFFPLNKNIALDLCFKWKDDEERNYRIDLPSQGIPDNIKDVDDTILNNIIGCSHLGKCEHKCTEAFKLTESELSFYKKNKIPVPNTCPNCRHYERLSKRNPMKLWHRSCMCDKEAHMHTNGTKECSNEFETSYAPDRPEIVYCEGCYNKEVY